MQGLDGVEGVVRLTRAPTSEPILLATWGKKRGNGQSAHSRDTDWLLFCVAVLWETGELYPAARVPLLRYWVELEAQGKPEVLISREVVVEGER